MKREPTEEEENPDDLSKSGLITRHTESMWVQVVPKEGGFCLLVLHVVDSLVLVVLLNPVTSPERIDDMLGF